MDARAKQLLAAGTTLVVAEPALALAHQGGLGAVFGLGLGIAAYYAASSNERETGKKTPSPVSLAASSDILQRLFRGKSVREQREAGPQQVIEPLQPRYDFQEKDVLSAPTFLPDGPIRFSDILKTFTPTLDKIYLATLPDGTHVFTSARNLCHTALAGATRGGKDHLIRQLMSQLCYAGANVYLLDPNYKRYDLESVDPWKRSYPEDWTPFEQHLANDPRELIRRGRTYKVIEHYLQSAYEMVERRLEILGRSEQRLGAPQFIVVNELPAVVDEVPKTGQYLKKILREGAKVGVFLVNASQDFQVTTTFKDIGGGIRKCYRTAFDVGADPATQTALGLLSLKGLGKGRASLRNDDVLSEGRVPWVDNEALYMLLGPSTYAPSGQQGQQQEQALRPYHGDSPEDDPEPPAPTAPRLYHRVPEGATHERKMARVQRLRNTPVAASEQPQRDETPETRLSEDEQRVLEAYRNGAKTGMAIKAMTGIAGTRVNECLHKLTGLGLIDWQPRQR